MMATARFDIPITKKHSVEAQLIKFNKRAERIGMVPISWDCGEAFTKTVDRTVKDGLGNHTIKENILFIPITVSGELEVSINGWEFIATLQHLKTGENIVRAINNSFHIPNEYRNSGSSCEHCKINRYRKDTFLLKHSNGDTIQVGRTCMANFLGTNNPENILNKASLVSEIIWFMGGSEMGSSKEDIVFPIIDFLSITNAIINKYGWISKTLSINTGKKSTASRVLDHYTDDNINNRITINQEDKSFATDAINWLEEMSDIDCTDSDYLYNIRTIVRSGMVERKTIGFAASIINAYDKHLKRTKENQAIESKHVGSIKDRQIFDLKVERRIPGDGMYGPHTFYSFIDINNNCFIWYAKPEHYLNVGQNYKIKGTIKNHTEFKGIKQTVLNRCEVIV